MNGQTDFTVKAEPEDFKNTLFLAMELSRAFHHLLAMRQVALFIHPSSWPLFEVWAISCKLIWRKY